MKSGRGNLNKTFGFQPELNLKAMKDWNDV